MPYDPNIPADHAELTGVMFRGQFTGLKDLIDAVNGITAVQVDGVTTLPAGSQASVSLQLTGSTLHFTFGIPEGIPGAQGGPGNDGGPGPIGPQGPPFANAVVDGVTTLDPGQNAAVNVSFDGSNVRFTFSIPRGDPGATGATGQPGEVTNAALAAAIGGTSSNTNAVANTLAQTSANTNAVSTLNTPYADPAAEELRQAYNALVLALRR
ncbi:MAG: hypothetical protein JNG86_03475 [Verrucomicrobiaceae bacterium]|nr:hypothetical protein [Verrucomicrobiaceae bacterium]